MKNFLKTFLASLMALVVGSGCLFFSGLVLLMGAIVGGSYSYFSSSSEPVVVKENTILKIDISTISEIAEEDPFASLMGGGDEQPVSLTDAVRAIALAKEDPNISAIYMNVEGIGAGLASVNVLRQALLDFKDSGKPIVSYADTYSQKAYYLSSVADQVLLNPEGSIELLGIATNTLMLRDAMDKLGVAMDVFKVGTYKSAVEPYIMNHISPENREQIEAYIQGLWGGMKEAIAQERGLSAEDVENFASSGKAFGETKGFLTAKLVDGLVYRREVDSLMREAIGVDEDVTLSMVSLATLATKANQEAPELGEDQVAVVYAEGEIISQKSGGLSSRGTYINTNLIDELAKLAKDDQVKAVVLRINSPGGSAFLSEQIHQEVVRLNELKPVVVSMGDVAASGGYYMAAPARRIFAEPYTLTGSIGIFGMVPNISGLTQKLGLHEEVVKTSKFANLVAGSALGLPMTPMTADEKQLIQGSVERGYRTFLTRVAEGRKMSLEAVDSVGQGRVWIAPMALTKGLVDEIGGLQDAIKYAAKEAGIEESYSVNYGTTKRDFLQELLASTTSSGDFVARLRQMLMSEQELALMRQIDLATRSVGVQARLPYEMAVY